MTQNTHLMIFIEYSKPVSFKMLILSEFNINYFIEINKNLQKEQWQLKITS